MKKANARFRIRRVRRWDGATSREVYVVIERFPMVSRLPGGPAEAIRGEYETRIAAQTLASALERSEPSPVDRRGHPAEFLGGVAFTSLVVVGLTLLG